MLQKANFWFPSVAFFFFSCSQFNTTDIIFKAADDSVILSQQMCVLLKYVQFSLSTCGCVHLNRVGGCKYSFNCFEYLIQSSQGINDFNILSVLIFKCHFIFSIHEFVFCGIQACDECVYRTLIIPIRMEIQRLHDGNLEEKKSWNLNLLSMFGEK